MDKHIFKRMDLQQICSFILFCEEKTNTEKLTYNERINNGQESLYKILKRVCKNENEYLRAIEDLDEILMVYEEVYTEIGMKAGAKIILQLLHSDDNAGIENRLK